MERWRIAEDQYDALPVVVCEDMMLVMEGEQEAEETSERVSKNKRGR